MKHLKQPDHSQIPVRKKDMKDVIQSCGSCIAGNLLFCISHGQDHPEYKLRMMTAALQGENIARLVYRGKDGYCKLPEKRYERWLFLDFCESAEEVKDRLVHRSARSIPNVEEVYQKYLRIKEIWVKAISYLYETPFASELAYGADYVIASSDLPMPEFSKWMFPSNYPEFDYASGIGEELFDIQMGCVPQ